MKAASQSHPSRRRTLLTAAVFAAIGCSAPTMARAEACDDALKSQFVPDADTHVLLVKPFKKGEPIALSADAQTPPPPVAPADLCLVKLLVGPGNPGPKDAPSTSAGIGIEVWLPAPANWNERIRAYGSGGWAGSAETDVTRIANGGDGVEVHVAAAGKGFVVATSDHGHMAGAGLIPALNGSFAVNPNGSINTKLWQDFAERSLHEEAVKTKALVKLYYGKPQTYAYWDGFSTGGRQGLKLAQVFPEDFDGILSGAPAINWTRFVTNELYPQIVMKQDLGAAMADKKLGAMTTAAVKACGGGDLGFLTDPLACRYDPTKDAAALCKGVAGNGGVTGASEDSATCANLAEATAINKIWYGQTTDGSAAEPSVDNAAGPALGDLKHLWFGLTRGTDLSLLAGAPNSPPFFGPFPIASDVVAQELRDPSIATPSFVNAVSNGKNKWAALDYEALALASYQGLTLQPEFANINTDQPNLSKFAAKGGKILLYHGLADNLIAPQGSINYYTRVEPMMGGADATQAFFRLYMVPGYPHDGRMTPNPMVPLPQAVTGRDEMFNALQAWVEKGVVPDAIEVSSAKGDVSMPLCVYPQKATYKGSGARTAASSYSCQ